MSFLVVLLVVICCFSGGLFHSVTATKETTGSRRQKESKTNDTYDEHNPDSIITASSTIGTSSGYNISTNSTNLTLSPTPVGTGDYYDYWYNDTTNATDTNATSMRSPSPAPFNGTVVNSPSSIPISPVPLVGLNSTTNSSNIWNTTNQTGTNATNGTDTSDSSSSTFSNETQGGDFNSSSPPSEYDSNETATNKETSSSYYNDTSNSTVSSEPWDLDNTTTTNNTTLVPTPAVTSHMTQQTDTKKTNATTSPSPTNTPTAAATVPYPKFDGHQFQPNANDNTQEEEEVTFTAYDYEADDAGASEDNGMLYSSSATSDDDIQQSNITKTVAIVLACVLITAFTAGEIQRNPHGCCANLTYGSAFVIWYLISTPILFLWRFTLNRATRRSTYHDADYFQEGTFQTTSRRGDQDLRYQPRSSRYIPRDLELS